MKKYLILFLTLTTIALYAAGAFGFGCSPTGVPGIGGGVEAAAGGDSYNVWDSQNSTNVSDLSTNESTGGTNAITELSGEQTIDVNDSGNNCYTYDTHTEASTTDFYYINIKFKMTEDARGS